MRCSICCFGNDIRLLGQFAGPCKVSAKGEAWLERPYKVMREASSQSALYRQQTEVDAGRQFDFLAGSQGTTVGFRDDTADPVFRHWP